MPVRKSSALWEGTLKEGNGQMRVGDGVYEGPYTAASRFEEGEGTNPEELIGAAHAGCFSMALAGILEKAGRHPTKLQTTANVHIEKEDGAYTITSVELNTLGEVPGIDEQTFEKHAKEAKNNCPVSRALNGVEIEVNATLKN